MLKIWQHILKQLLKKWKVVMKTDNQKISNFFTIWLGQFVSLIGSGLTGFALGLKIYMDHGSVTKYGLIFFCSVLPVIIFSPIAGVLVDRWNRRNAMLFSDMGAGLVTVMIVLLLIMGKLNVWTIYLATIVIAFFGTFQTPAFAAATTQMVPQRHMGRASGMIKLLDIHILIAPTIACILLEIIQLQGIIIVDIATALFAVLTLLMVKIPNLKLSEADKEKKNTSSGEIREAWVYLKKRPGFLGILSFFFIKNYFIALMFVLFTPFVLSFSSTADLGKVIFSSGMGMVCGGMLMTIWGGPKRFIYGLLTVEFLSALCFLPSYHQPSIPLMATGGFLIFFFMAVSSACSQAIWQKKVEPAIQGRVFALRRMIAFSSMPIAFVTAGALADYIFEPLMAKNGALSGLLGPLFGTGPGRGIALMFTLIGIITLINTLAATLYPRLRRIELELPDAVTEG